MYLSFSDLPDGLREIIENKEHIEHLEQQLALARALLEEFAVDETEHIGLYWDESVGMAVCVYCESGNGHLPECPIVKARAFLGKEA